jgi:hypothetical protein
VSGGNFSGGFDPAEIDALEAKMEAAAVSHDVEQLTRIVGDLLNVCKALNVQLRCLGDLTFKSTDALLGLGRRVGDVERHAAELRVMAEQRERRNPFHDFEG